MMPYRDELKQNSVNLAFKITVQVFKKNNAQGERVLNFCSTECLPV